MELNELKKLRSMRLSDQEKKDLFGRISKKTGANLEYLRGPQSAVPSPFFSFSLLMRSKHLYAGMLSIFILVITGATAFASLHTLPGDLLYGVKTNVVEQLPRLIYLSPEKRAVDSVKKIEKRIKEFEQLAEEGRLTEENTVKIEEDINIELTDLDENIEKIEEKITEAENKTEESGELTTKLETSLEIQAEKIKVIRDDEKVADKNALSSVIERIEDKKDVKEEESKEENSDSLKDIEKEILPVDPIKPLPVQEEILHQDNDGIPAEDLEEFMPENMIPAKF